MLFCLQEDSNFWKVTPPIPFYSMGQGNDPARDDLAPGSSSGELCEVELDSLGRLFTKLADTPSSQGDSEASQAGDVEVIPIFPVPEKSLFKEGPGKPSEMLKISNQAAHLASNFLLKETQLAGQ